MFAKLPYAIVSWLILVFSIILSNPAFAEQPIPKKTLAPVGETKSDIQSLSEVQSAKTSANYLLRTPRNQNFVPQISQVVTDVVAVTEVKVNRTDKGIELILVTANSQKLQVLPKTEGNSYIADIKNAKLQLASKESFRQLKPVVGIAEVTLANVDANTLQVTVVGETGAPVVELFDSQTEGLVLGVTPAVSTAQQPTTPQTKPEQKPEENQPPIELQVTASPDTYRVPDTSVGTRTNTPLRDIPQSIQVAPRQLIEDQGARNIYDVVRNFNVQQLGQTDSSGFVTIRGFQMNTNVLRNGLKDPITRSTNGAALTNVERVEVLKGPASVLYGEGQPGGTINYVTKQPLTQPYYSVELSGGSYDFYRPAIDFSSPLTSDKNLSYRINASYENSNYRTDFLHGTRLFVAPVISWRIGPNTNLTLEGEYQDRSLRNDPGLPAVGTVLSNTNGNIPLNRYLGDPNFDFNKRQTIRIGYNFDHSFNENWSLQNSFRAVFLRINQKYVFPISFQTDNRLINRGLFDSQPLYWNTYSTDTHVVGKFNTGSIQHQLLLGFDFTRQLEKTDVNRVSLTAIDVFNPVYGGQKGTILGSFNTKFVGTDIGLYAQDQISVTNNLKLLLGGRFTWIISDDTDRISSTFSSITDFAFTPRVGIVYQPIEPVSLYASYIESFTQSYGTSFSGELFKPTRGKQYEVGVKTDFFNNKLSATLALYQLTFSNLSTPDLVNSGFSIQTGEQRSRGVELNVTGEILPGWNVFASYTYTDARITEDNRFPIGNRLINAPENSFSLWTKYIIPKGNLQGLGIGLGLFYSGDRQGDLNNSFQVPSYLRTDAALYYRKNNFDATLNFKNLFDIDYFASVSGPFAVYPGDPFTAELTLKWQF